MRPRYLVPFCFLLFALSLPASPAPERRFLSLDTFRDRLRGGWAGQMIGVSYGSIYEFRSLNKPITTPLREWKPEFVSNSLDQDDIYVEMTFLKTLATHGPKVTRRQAGLDFRDSKYRLWHANMAARENLKQGIMPPESGHPRFNPHADDIDFQIEADLFGLVTPGMPEQGLKLADVFGSIMNWGDGLYGGRLITAMYCQAYLEAEPTPAAIDRCLRAGLAALPAESAYARIVRDVIAGHRANPDDWLKTWQQIQDRWGEDDLCPEGHYRPFNIDAKLNGAYIVLGLLYGGGDFAKTLEITTRCGQDADCNPSNAAGILGVLYGYHRLPEVYTRGIPALDGRKFSYTDYDYPALIEACEQVTRRLLGENGGRVVREKGAEGLSIPLQQPSAPKQLDQMKIFGMDQLLAWRADFDRRLTQARRGSLDKALSGWAPGWRVVATGDAMPTGLMAVLDRPQALVTHPVSRTEPAALERKLRLPRKSPRLALLVTSYPDRAEADWELRALVDGQQIDRRVVHTPGRWQEVSLDLTPHAGREVTLRLENAAGGGRDWAWEAGYWGRIEIEGE